MSLQEWKHKINSILGYFWTDVFRDAWLLTAIHKAFAYVIGQPVFDIIQCIKKQLTFAYTPKTEALFPIRALIPI